MGLDYDSEMNILEDIHDLDPKECLILSDFECSEYYDETASILDTILGKDYLEYWLDNSKSSNPPDFINSKHCLMMEMMRFDDHSKDGKINPVLAREKQLNDDIRMKLELPKDVRVHVIARTNLPTEEDHNYKSLYASFQRTIRKHLSKLDKYKSNFPNFKSVFLAVNESSGVYLEITEPPSIGMQHLLFFDNRFLSEFIGSDLDYLIVYSPYNYFETIEKHQLLPHLVIFDVKRLKDSKMIRRIDYNEEKMISNEI